MGLDWNGWDGMGWEVISYIRIFKHIVYISGFGDIYKHVQGDFGDILYIWYILVYIFGIFG